MDTNASITVYTRLDRIIGEMYGKVIFQKNSHAVAPSMLAASFAEGGMVWSAERKISIWIPEFHTRFNTPDVMSLMMSVNVWFRL